MFNNGGTKNRFPGSRLSIKPEWRVRSFCPATEYLRLVGSCFLRATLWFVDGSFGLSQLRIFLWLSLMIIVSIESETYLTLSWMTRTILQCSTFRARINFVLNFSRDWRISATSWSFRGSVAFFLKLIFDVLWVWFRTEFYSQPLRDALHRCFTRRKRTAERFQEY